MKIYLFDQSNYLKKHLQLLKSLPVMPYRKEYLKEKNSTIDLPLLTLTDRKSLAFFFNYQLFPSSILTYYSQWQDEKREMREGDTIIQQVYLPPLKTFSQKIIFGVRICEIIEEPGRTGFSYETLEGHAEKGISTFTVEQSGDRVLFRIHTFSAPGNFFSKILGPIFSSPYQDYCTRRALQNVKLRLAQEKAA